MKRFQAISLILVISIAFVLRLYKIDNPIADWHSWRQADTSSVTRRFVQESLNPLYPRFDDLSATASGLDNPQGWRMVEFPIFNIIHYYMYQLLPDLSPQNITAFNEYWSNSIGTTPPEVPTTSLELYGRLTSVIASLFTIYFLFQIVLRLTDFKTATTSATLYAVLPYSIYYSRVILPDPMMITFSLAAIYTFIKHLDTYPSSPKHHRKVYIIHYAWFSLSIILAAIALLLKPTAIFLLTVIPALAYWKHESKVLSQKILYIYPIIAALPLMWWRLVWIPQFPEGIAANAWLLNGDGIRLRPAWFRWLFYERIGLLILGGFGLIPWILGIITKSKHKNDWIYLVWLLSSILYLTIFATGNVKHDYYQIPIIPIICILTARGLLSLWESSAYHKFLSKPATIFITSMMLFMSWYNVRGYYQINNPAIVKAGIWADTHIPPEAKVVAPYQGDTAFLYQTKRQGWPVMAGSAEDMVEKGATYYISTTEDTQTKDLMREYDVLTWDPKTGIFIINLTKPRVP